MATPTARWACALLLSELLFGQGTGHEKLNTGEILGLALRTIPTDISSVTMAPFRHPRESGFVAGGLLLLVAADRPLTRAWQQEVEPRVQYQIRGLWKTSGTGPTDGADTWLVASLPAWYLGSLATGSSRGQVAAVLSVKAAAYAVLVGNLTLKTAFARERPLGNLASAQPEPGHTANPWRWGQFHPPYMGARPNEPTAFPSFHFTLYFAVARVFHEVYDSPWLPYGLALVGLGSQIKSHQHWVSDMTAGTLLGLGIGHTVVQTFRGATAARLGKVAYALQPWTDLQGQSGLALRMVW